MHPASPSLVFALALAAGAAAQLLARVLGIPGIVVMLAAGVVLGPDVLGLLNPRHLGGGLFPLVSLAVAVILFEGGMALDLRAVRRAAAPVRRLITLGAAVTTVGGAVAAHVFLGWSWRLSLLFGTLVIVTGPTVIRPLLRHVALRSQLATVLEAEGLLIDPVGAIVAGVVLQWALAPSLGSVPGSALALLARLAFGAGAGLVFGLALASLLRWHRVVPEELGNLVALAGALLVYEACESVLTESGILAVTVTGVVVGNLWPTLAEELGEFQGHLTVGLIGVLFVLLAADVRLAEVASLGAAGLATVGALVVVVRPVAVWLCTPGSELNSREKAFLAWLMPRGVVAAAVASLAAGFLDSAGASGGAEIRALVFLTIAITVVVQGGSAPWVARLLGVSAPGRDAVVILGAEETGLALADLLRQGGHRVVFADVNPAHCRAAEERGFPVVYGDALEDRTLARMQLERARVALGLTTNNEVNRHFAEQARASFGVKQAYVAVNRSGGEVSARLVEKQALPMLFERPEDLNRWNVRLRHGSAKMRRFRVAELHEPPQDAQRGGSLPDPYLLVALLREGVWQPIHDGLELREGDVVAAAIHLPEEAAARQALRELGFEPAPEATAPSESTNDG